MEWADKARTLGVRTNADQPDQAANAIAFGAEGIGLCRTEHMFFEGDRIDAMREMILAETKEDARGAAARQAAAAAARRLRRHLPRHGRAPVTIRTLDPPLHEFLPHDAEDSEEVAAVMGVTPDEVAAKVEDLHEANPMLGHRGCRLGIAYPEITEMQARAILEAACIVKKEGVDVHPEIMIPLVGTKKELEDQAAIVRKVAAEVFAEQGVEVDYLVGTMIEIPRGALTADEIAEEAGVLQLRHQRPHADGARHQPRRRRQVPAAVHQRGDHLAGRPVPRRSIRPAWASWSKMGVRARPQRSARPQGRHLRRARRRPESVKFCHRPGLDYVSCSPFRVPVARLAAAQARGGVGGGERAARCGTHARGTRPLSRLLDASPPSRW